MINRIKQRLTLKRVVIAINILLLPLTLLLGYRYLCQMFPADPIVNTDIKDTVMISGPIQQFTADPINSRINQLVTEGREEITIIIDSPGGELVAGLSILQAINNAQYFGTNVRCIVQGKAMSMALIIFSECNTRLATFDSLLMWHSVAMYGYARVNVDFLEKMAEIVNTQNSEMWASTRQYFFPWYFSKHFTDETQLSAIDIEQNGLGYLKVIRQLNITGVPVIEPVQPITVKKKGK